MAMCAKREDGNEERVWDRSAVEVSEGTINQFDCFSLI